MIGLGNVGRRHLQSLISSARWSVDVLDHLPLGILSSRVESNFFNSEINFIPYLRRNQHYDLVIVASNASGRVELLQNLIEQNCTWEMLLVEKPVANTLEAAYKLDGLPLSNAFVNHHRRYQYVYQIIQRSIQNSQKNLVSIDFRSMYLGLLCNYAHHLDLARMLGAGSVECSSVKLLAILDSKRSGYKDASGTTCTYFDTGVNLFTECGRGSENRVCVVTFDNGEIWTLDESQGVVYDHTGRVIAAAKSRPQSEMTFGYWHDFMAYNHTRLPTLASSNLANIPFLEDLGRQVADLEMEFQFS